jgi:hypothetical protein
LASVPDWLRRELPLTGLASGRFEAQGEPQEWQLRASLYAESLQYDQTVARDNTAQVIVQARDGAVQVDVVSAQARVGDGALLRPRDSGAAAGSSRRSGFWRTPRWTRLRPTCLWSTASRGARLCKARRQVRPTRRMCACNCRAIKSPSTARCWAMWRGGWQ